MCRRKQTTCSIYHRRCRLSPGRREAGVGVGADDCHGDGGDDDEAEVTLTETKLTLKKGDGGREGGPGDGGQTLSGRFQNDDGDVGKDRL